MNNRIYIYVGVTSPACIGVCHPKYTCDKRLSTKLQQIVHNNHNHYGAKTYGAIGGRIDVKNVVTN